MKVEASIIINVPSESVFAYVAEMENNPQWLPLVLEVKRISDARVGVGTRYKQTHRLPLRQRLKGTIEITTYEPCRTLSFNSTSGPFSYRGHYHIEPISRGARFTQVLEWHAGGLLKLIEPLLAFAFKHRGDQYMLYESSILKKVLEQREPTTVATDMREVKR